MFEFCFVLQYKHYPKYENAIYVLQKIIVKRKEIRKWQVYLKKDLINSLIWETH